MLHRPDMASTTSTDLTDAGSPRINVNLLPFTGNDSSNPGGQPPTNSEDLKTTQPDIMMPLQDFKTEETDPSNNLQGEGEDWVTSLPGHRGLDLTRQVYINLPSAPAQVSAPAEWVSRNPDPDSVPSHPASRESALQDPPLTRKALIPLGCRRELMELPDTAGSCNSPTRRNEIFHPWTPFFPPTTDDHSDYGPSTLLASIRRDGADALKDGSQALFLSQHRGSSITRLPSGGADNLSGQLTGPSEAVLFQRDHGQGTVISDPWTKIRARRNMIAVLLPLAYSHRRTDARHRRQEMDAIELSPVSWVPAPNDTIGGALLFHSNSSPKREFTWTKPDPWQYFPLPITEHQCFPFQIAEYSNKQVKNNYNFTERSSDLQTLRRSLPNTTWNQVATNEGGTCHNRLALENEGLRSQLRDIKELVDAQRQEFKDQVAALQRELFDPSLHDGMSTTTTEHPINLDLFLDSETNPRPSTAEPPVGSTHEYLHMYAPSGQFQSQVNPPQGNEYFRQNPEFRTAPSPQQRHSQGYNETSAASGPQIHPQIPRTKTEWALTPDAPRPDHNQNEAISNPCKTQDTGTLWTPARIRALEDAISLCNQIETRTGKSSHNIEGVVKTTERAADELARTRENELRGSRATGYEDLRSVSEHLLGESRRQTARLRNLADDKRTAEQMRSTELARLPRVPLELYDGKPGELPKFEANIRRLARGIPAEEHYGLVSSKISPGYVSPEHISAFRNMPRPLDAIFKFLHQRAGDPALVAPSLNDQIKNLVAPTSNPESAVTYCLELADKLRTYENSVHQPVEKSVLLNAVTKFRPDTASRLVVNFSNNNLDGVLADDPYYFHNMVQLACEEELSKELAYSAAGLYQNKRAVRTARTAASSDLVTSPYTDKDKPISMNTTTLEPRPPSPQKGPPV